MVRGKRIDKNTTMKEILAFSLLPFGILFTTTTVNSIISMYMTDVLKLSMSFVSIILLGTKLWDAINDPIMGSIVERTRTKWGKCRPYLIWMSLPLCLTVSMLFFPATFPAKFDFGNGNIFNFIYMLFGYMLYISVLTAIDIPYNSLLPLVFPDQGKRVKAISTSTLLGSMGSIIPSLLVFTVIDLFGNGSKDSSNMGYFWAGLMFSAMGCILISVSFFKIKEKVYIPSEKPQYKKCLKTVFSNKRVLVLFVCIFFYGAVNVVTVFLPYFAKWNTIGVLPMDKLNAFLNNLLGKFIKGEIKLSSTGLMVPMLSIGSGISYMLSMALVPVFLKKFSKRQLFIGASIFGFIANVTVYLIGIYLLPYNTVAGCFTFIALRFFTNFPVGMSTVLIISMCADLSDELEVESGERLEATIYSFKGLLHKVSIAIFNVVVLQIVGFAGYNALKMDEISDGLTKPLIESTTQANIIDGVNYTGVLNTIFLMLTVFTGVAMLIQTIPMFFYKETTPEMFDKIKEYREKKKEEREAKIREAQVLDENNAKIEV